MLTFEATTAIQQGLVVLHTIYEVQDDLRNHFKQVFGIMAGLFHHI